MQSENAAAVAREVLRAVGSGRKVKKTEIQRKYGYSQESARSGKATSTKTYKKIMKPILDRMKNERDRILKEMCGRNLAEEEYKVLVDALDKMTKNIELLSGRPTEREETLLNDEQINALLRRRTT